jgi:hypothetical protein
MSSSSTFVEKVQALQPELAGSSEEDKTKIRGLVSEVPTLAKDLQVRISSSFNVCEDPSSRIVMFFRL